MEKLINSWWHNFLVNSNFLGNNLTFSQIYEFVPIAIYFPFFSHYHTFPLHYFDCEQIQLFSNYVDSSTTIDANYHTNVHCTLATTTVSNLCKWRKRLLFISIKAQIWVSNFEEGELITKAHNSIMKIQLEREQSKYFEKIRTKSFLSFYKFRFRIFTLIIKEKKFYC